MNKWKEKLLSLWRKLLHDPLMTHQVFRENEVRANLLIARIMLASAGVFLVCWLLNGLGVLQVSQQYVLPTFLVGSVAFAAPAVITFAFHGEKSWIKTMLLISATLVLAYIDSILTFNTPLLIIFPVVFSCRYFSGATTIRTALLTTVLFAVSAWCGAVFNYQNPDMNFVGVGIQQYTRNIMLLSFLPKWMTAMVISAFCYEVAHYGKKMVLEQDEVSQKTARDNAELEMAENIQNQALPTVESLTENPYRRFDLAAKMFPAKEVGGDFYDFFYPDESHIALIIADVANKGISASLYMMMAKALLNSRIDMAHSPGRILERVNQDLSINSSKGMFVTVWLGILDLKTGELAASNAGHEYPVIRRKDGNFEIIKDKHGFVLGGYAGLKFPEYTIRLNKGDTLFVYTDGVPEANDADGQMFGMERMLEALNRHKDCGMEALVAGVRADIHDFTGNAAQFDDITMLAFQLQEPVGNDGMTVTPVMEALYPVQAYIQEEIGTDTLRPIQLQKLGIAVDEIFSNIVKYSQAKEVQVLCTVDDTCVRVTFKDDGLPFDPLTADASVAPTPKTSGGLGIFITRKIMDHVEYAYRDNRNELTVTLLVKENAQ